MDGQSLDITAEKIAQLRVIFPEVFAEDKIDFARLKAILGENVVFFNEHYELNWAGKAEARKEIQKQTTATLIPDKQSSVNFSAAGNLFIEGENLEVLRVLQKSYFGKVKLIYIDPPYNTGNDSFVYPDDYAEREADNHIKFFFKLPRGFKVPTPIGDYIPDWAVVFENDRRIYFVAETKGKLDKQLLREIERMKIDCGAKHFALFKPLGVEYKLAVTVNELYG